MAYFKPLEYIPFAPSGPPLKRSGVEEDHSGWQWTESPEAFARRKAHVANTQYRDYSGQQLQSLFDAVNDLGRSPAITGEMFNNAPSYSPYGGTRADFTTGGGEYYDHGQERRITRPPVFNQQGYLDAQFNNMNNYLSKLGSYFGNMGSPQSASAQQILANAPAQGPMPIMPSVGNSSLNIAGGGISANNPFQSFGVKSGGWGTAPTSLFGAGAGNASNP